MDRDGHNLGYDPVDPHDFWGMIDYYSEPMDEHDELGHGTLAHDDVKVNSEGEFTNIENFDNPTYHEEVSPEINREAMLEIINNEFDKEIAIREEELRNIEENLQQAEAIWDKMQSIWTRKIYSSFSEEADDESGLLKGQKKKKKPKLLPQKPLFYRLTDGSFVRYIHFYLEILLHFV